MKCGAAYHGWVRCANVGDDEFNAWVKENRNIKPCPQCRIKTWKYDGCNHITCQKCHYEWCWVCFGKYRSPGGHYVGLFMCPGGQFGSANTSFTVLKLILLIVFGPLIFLLSPILIGFCYPWAILCNGPGDCHMNFILFLLALPLGTALGCIVGALALVILTIPFEFIQMIRLLRILFFKLGLNCCMPCGWA